MTNDVNDRNRARPPRMNEPLLHPNVPKPGYKPNPANHVGAELPPERQAPQPNRLENIGRGALIGDDRTDDERVEDAEAAVEKAKQDRDRSAEPKGPLGEARGPIGNRGPEGPAGSTKPTSGDPV